MVNLTRASKELLRRTPDETFPSLSVLLKHCRWQKEQAMELWQPPAAISAVPASADQLLLTAGEQEGLRMTDWSFGQLCRLAGVAKETVNRLSAETASRVLRETLPQGSKPMQLLVEGDRLRSIHAATYTRLYSADLLALVEEYATDFQPPPTGFNGATGLYGGEQDMFVFLIDPLGWTEIDGGAFAPGFFLWNSEVGSRAVGIQTFWYEQICSNHIVWDAVEVLEFTRKHTANVHEALDDVRWIIENLAAKRDARRDGFAKAVEKAMRTKLGDDAEEVLKVLSQHAIPRALAQAAVEVVPSQGSQSNQGRFTVFSLVDALTRLSREIVNAGDRMALDQKFGRLLSLALAA